MSNNNIKVKNNNQKGGITAGVINLHDNSLKENQGMWSNPWFKYLFIPLMVILIGSIVWNVWGDQMFGKKENNTQEIYNVESHNQSGGVTAGKIDNFNQVIIKDKEDTIQTIFLEAKLTVTKKPNMEKLPPEVEFLPSGDSHAYLENGKDKVKLQFQSPVQFLENNEEITIINRFTLQPGSVLQNKPIELLNSYESLSVPIVTVVFGDFFDKITLLEISLVANGETVFKKEWKYDVIWKNGPRFSIPLK